MLELVQTRRPAHNLAPGSCGRPSAVTRELAAASSAKTTKYRRARDIICVQLTPDPTDRVFRIGVLYF